MARALKFDFKLDVCFVPKPTPATRLGDWTAPFMVVYQDPKRHPQCADDIPTTSKW